MPDDLRNRLLKAQYLGNQNTESPVSASRAGDYLKWAEQEERQTLKTYNSSDDDEQAFDRMEEAGDLKRDWKRACDLLSGSQPGMEATDAYHTARKKQETYNKKYGIQREQVLFGQAAQALGRGAQQAGQPSVGEAARNSTPIPGQQPTAPRTPSTNQPVGQRPWEQGQGKGTGHGRGV